MSYACRTHRFSMGAKSEQSPNIFSNGFPWDGFPWKQKIVNKVKLFSATSVKNLSSRKFSLHAQSVGVGRKQILFAGLVDRAGVILDF